MVQGDAAAFPCCAGKVNGIKRKLIRGVPYPPQWPKGARQIPFGTIVPDEDVALPEEMERDVVKRLKDLLRPFVKQRKKDAVYRCPGGAPLEWIKVGSVSFALIGERARCSREDMFLWLPLSPYQKARPLGGV